MFFCLTTEIWVQSVDHMNALMLYVWTEHTAAEPGGFEEQLILRLMLAYIGEKDDLSWKNAQQSCKDAKKLPGMQ